MKTLKHPDRQTAERTRHSVLRQLAILPSLSLDELRDKWRDLYGAEPPRYQRQFLIKRLAYRIQELFHGGLSASAKARLAKVAESDPVAQVIAKPAASRSREDQLLPGTRLIRMWNDQRHEVIAQASQEYAHGGLSLQECLTLELTVTPSKSGPTSQTVAFTQILWRGLRCSVTTSPSRSDLSLDIRLEPGNPASSVLQTRKRLTDEGKASVLVEDDLLVGNPAWAVLLDGAGDLVATLETTIGKS